MDVQSCGWYYPRLDHSLAQGVSLSKSPDTLLLINLNWTNINPSFSSKRDFWRSDDPNAIQQRTIAGGHPGTGIVSTIIAGTDAGSGSDESRDPEKGADSEKTPQAELQQIKTEHDNM